MLFNQCLLTEILTKFCHFSKKVNLLDKISHEFGA